MTYIPLKTEGEIVSFDGPTPFEGPAKTVLTETIASFKRRKRWREDDFRDAEGVMTMLVEHGWSPPQEDTK